MLAQGAGQWKTRKTPESFGCGNRLTFHARLITGDEFCWKDSCFSPASGRASASVSLFLIFSPFPLPFLFFFPLPPFHHFPSEAFPSGRGRAGLTPRLSPAPAALWREGAPSSPGHQRRRSEERDRRRRPRAQGHHGTSSLSDPSAAAVRPARVPAPAGPVCPLLPPQTARPWSRAPRCRAPRIMRW